ncbi:AGAP009589-PA-like protein [Anopheles sinensis]|uniref:AGAP009589-PA-like protein n=1 Tax=Anopheles sinensis TaxID=74873 RepID=A0A084VBY8_ANOSI|nr:AGAP009589-PA-like protein [Anopheles sinensis]
MSTTERPSNIEAGRTTAAEYLVDQGVPNSNADKSLLRFFAIEHVHVHLSERVRCREETSASTRLSSVARSYEKKAKEPPRLQRARRRKAEY